MPEPDTLTPTVFIRPWTDPVVDRVGHDPRSEYVERFWLGTLGPSTTWLIRRLAARFDVEPDGFELSLIDMGHELGLGGNGGKHSPIMRALKRLIDFDLARETGGALEIRRALPPLSYRQVVRLPVALRQTHPEPQRRRYVVRWVDPSDGFVHRATYHDRDVAEAKEAEMRGRGMTDVYAVCSD